MHGVISPEENGNNVLDTLLLNSYISIKLKFINKIQQCKRINYQATII